MHILIAVDGSDRAASVVSGVKAWLPADHARVTLLTVLDSSEMRGVLEHAPHAQVEQWGSMEVHEPVPASEPPARVVEYKSQAVDYAVAEARAGLAQYEHLIPGDVEWDVRVTVKDDAAAAILETAREIGADAIVVGTHGRTGLRRALMGSTAEAVIRHARQPVLVVPTGPAAAEAA